jgi:hypothetical protein
MITEGRYLSFYDRYRSDVVCAAMMWETIQQSFDGWW